MKIHEKIMSLLKGPNTKFIRKENILANTKGQTLNVLGREVSLLIGPVTTFIRQESVFAGRAGH